ncbi:Retrovirus-related Pol polyprotein from transposon TNT 1-94 [Eumeta japonica]|uniref:Retrovirus-related Pol polyprotein from transposon TNT 1-94 n=1 Tax=Eumeta variegata TaxID=151549 RepID=A0A4C1U966_EUMVA|nr:Retrovirus-related Pol polyprotein from transposon TNT 1-94 [Eumeta japonica]
MGHLNFHDVKKLPDVTEGVTLTQQQSNIACTHCMEGRQARMPFKSVGSRAERPLELIHSDLCGPMENSSFEVHVVLCQSREKILAEALATAAYVVNRSPTKSLQGKTPYEMWKATSSSVQPESTQSSSGKENHTPETSTSERLLGSKDPDTQEGNSESSSEYDTDTGELDDTYYPPYPMKQDYESNITLRSTRSQNKQTEVQNPKKSLLCLFTDLTDPQTVEEALASPQAADWKQAMNEEYASLMKNKTWSLTELPPGKKALPSARYGLEIDQMDAVSAFLQGEIDRDIYMQQPEEYKQGEQNPTAEHWNAVKRIFRYLQGTKDLKLTYTKDGDENITGYCDADWASDVCDRKSCTGYTFLLQGGAISWRSHKQQTVALSTAEAEYMAMSSAAQEALWLQQLHAEVGQQQKNPLVIFSDNESAIKLSNNNCYLPRSRHIDIRYHFLKDHVNNFDIKFSYVKGENMIADNLTKGTTADKHLYCIEKMGLRSKGGC